jgi:uncharacterized cupredoxin-like copper-binding protein
MRRLFLVTCFCLAMACAPAPGREIAVALTEYAFVPATIEVSAGERVRLVVRNIGRLEHDFAADQRGRALGLSGVHLAPGASANVDWTAPADPTELRIICSVSGHEALGMVARLVVLPRPGTARGKP